ncbi:MAG: dicarboxylate/amino acid:cation symporter [Candidatus Poribacteria bacterium]|nr:dicarboxylate/amino acid:cation symporter [Candidatus Poribacteria bacterium]|tara:strand:- start:740 stop:2338 length:1599 start_codon:yes stop_codon:yes gene_type:complete
MNKNESQQQNTESPIILIGIVVAIIVGTIIGGAFPEFAVNFKILGDIFLNSLKMMVVPLVILSMIVGITGLGDVRNIGSIGGRTVAYYTATTAISVILGIILVNIIRPGDGISSGEEHPDYDYTVVGQTVTLIDKTWNKKQVENFKDKYQIVLPSQNVQGRIKSISSNSATVSSWRYIEQADNVFYLKVDSTEKPFKNLNGQVLSADPELSATGKGVNIILPIADKVAGKKDKGITDTLTEVVLGNKTTGKQGMIPTNVFKAMVQMDILPLIVFSLLIGSALTIIGDHAQVAISTISALNDGVMKIVHWIMLISPIGIFGLIAGKIGSEGGFDGFLPELMAVGKYSLTVLIGLGIHAIFILPLLLVIFGKRNPISFASGMATALLNAFSTASSSATLPLTMDGLENNNGVSNRTSSFVLPLGATINMDGTALYEAVGAIFIAQVYGQNLGFAQQLVIVLTATLAAIGAAGIPQAGLVTMVIVLKAVDLPIEGIGLILTVDWLLDRFRTTVNVWGDSIGAGIIENLEDSTNAT